MNTGSVRVIQRNIRERITGKRGIGRKLRGPNPSKLRINSYTRRTNKKPGVIAKLFRAATSFLRGGDR